MSGSVTVVGSKTYSGGVGHPNGSLGLLTVTGAFQPGAISPLQTLLTTYSGYAVAGAVNFENLDAATLSGSQAVTVGSAGFGVFELSNTSSITGHATAGAMDVTVDLPSTYNVIVADAPGVATINGGGASNTVAVFAAESTVSYFTGGGSGTVAAGGGGDFIVASGQTWSLNGASTGNDTINSVAANATVTTYGQGKATGNAIGSDTTPSNVVGLAGSSATVISNGTNDLVETYAGNDIVSVNGSANVLINGGSDTVYATASSTAVKAFFNLFGGALDFINQSGVAATVSGAVPGASGGSTTAFGGIGGGVYIGGLAGNNSLVGGTGSVTLVGAGTNNFLSAQGSYGSYATQNELKAGDGGATLVAGASTDYNEFYGGLGTDSIVSFGSGVQSFYVGTAGSENITGSTASGASNNYYFDQDSSGDGADVITNFIFGRDNIYINLNSSVSGVAISGYTAINGGANTIVTLTDNTTITLYGIKASQLSASIIGGTHIG
jgi:hypothetical protein